VCVESLSTFKGSVEAALRSVCPTWANLPVETAASATVEGSSSSTGLIAGGRFFLNYYLIPQHRRDF